VALTDGKYHPIPTELQQAGGELMNAVKGRKWAHCWDEAGSLKTEHELIKNGWEFKHTSWRRLTGITKTLTLTVTLMLIVTVTVTVTVTLTLTWLW